MLTSERNKTIICKKSKRIKSFFDINFLVLSAIFNRTKENLNGGNILLIKFLFTFICFFRSFFLLVKLFCLKIFLEIKGLLSFEQYSEKKSLSSSPISWHIKQ